MHSNSFACQFEFAGYSFMNHRPSADKSASQQLSSGVYAISASGEEESTMLVVRRQAREQDIGGEGVDVLLRAGAVALHLVVCRRGVPDSSTTFLQ